MVFRLVLVFCLVGFWVLGVWGFIVGCVRVWRFIWCGVCVRSAVSCGGYRMVGCALFGVFLDLCWVCVWVYGLVGFLSVWI